MFRTRARASNAWALAFIRVPQVAERSKPVGHVRLSGADADEGEKKGREEMVWARRPDWRGLAADESLPQREKRSLSERSRRAAERAAEEGDNGEDGDASDAAEPLAERTGTLAKEPDDFNVGNVESVPWFTEGNSLEAEKTLLSDVAS